MAERLGKCLPNQGRFPKSGRRMAVEEMQFPRRWNGSMIFLNLGLSGHVR